MGEVASAEGAEAGSVGAEAGSVGAEEVEAGGRTKGPPRVWRRWASFCTRARARPW